MADDSSRRVSDLGARLGALASGFVAVLALVISAYTVYLQRQQLKAQLWPRVLIEAARTDHDHFTVSLKNRGVAPAEVRAFRLTVAGEYTTDWFDWLKRIGLKQGVQEIEGGSFSMNAPEGEVIGVGEDLEIFKTDSLQAISLALADDDTAMSLCYCSVLDDCWVYDAPAGEAKATTTPVERCPTYPTAFVGAPRSIVKKNALELRDAGSARDQ
jgi:hypothetical protein